MSHTLLLNQSYEPISVLPLSVIHWHNAIKLIYLQRISVVETYSDWVVRSEHMIMNVPSVCVTHEYYDHKKHVKYSRTNLYLRDLFTCQYCGEIFDHDDLTIDHVFPRSMGGHKNWENTVTCCKACNSRKGDKIIKPLRAPYKPDYYNLVDKWKHKPVEIKNPGWAKYLGITVADSDDVDQGVA